MCPSLCGDEGEHPLAVSVAANEGGRAGLGESLIELVQTGELAVVGQDPSVLGERMGIGHAQAAGAGVTDVRDKDCAAKLLGVSGELRILPGRDRLLVHDRLAVVVEHSDPGAVGLAMALRGQAIGRVEQPERSAH